MSEWIMLVDDEPHLLIATSHRLRSCGYHVLPARDGREAIELARESKVDLMVLDIRMPEIDGFETLEELRKIPGWETIPVIFLTANAQPINRERATELGCAFFLQKPCEATLLLEAIREAMQPLGERTC